MSELLPPFSRKTELLTQADAGSPNAYYELGLIAVEEEDDPITALAWFLRASRAELLDAQYSVGAMLEQGLGVPSDLLGAYSCFYYVVGREDGNDDEKEMSREGLARLSEFLSPEEINQARERALDEKSGLFDHIQASFDRTLDLTERDIAAKKAIIRETSDLNAAFELGQILDRGLGTKKDFEQAAQWYEFAAEGGHAEAQFQLASLYLEGTGVPLDEEIGALWMESAANKEVAGAQNWLGAHLEGMGRIEEARIWYDRAAAQGHSKAMMNIGTMFVNGSLGNNLFEEALKWWNKAVDLDDDEAMLNIGFAYQRGDGLPQDLPRALAYFRLALHFSPPSYSMKPYILVVGLTNELSQKNREKAEEIFLELLEKRGG